MENELSYKVIGAAIEVHKILGGPGLLEGVYESCLCRELVLRGLKVLRQVPVPVTYKGETVREPLILDILVEDKLIVEVKATERDCSLFQAQLLTYLRLTGLKLGILINFGKESIKEGINRVVNGL
jgi:GxxExxY protein